MKATARGRQSSWPVGVAALALLGQGVVAPQAQAQGLFGRSKTATTPSKDVPADKAKDQSKAQVVKIIPKEMPVSPNDAIAVVNGEVITRQQLADETIAREGRKVAEAMIAGKLIDQAIAAKKMTITSADIEEEINSIARGMGTTKENWLRTLDKERGVSPLQYKRDIVYRVVALRKLAEPRVQVTDEDMKKAYEANYGEKLHYRVIMTSTIQDAKAIWTELKQNPGAFERIAREDRRSIDTETKPIGGMGLQPMSRHAYPLTLSKGAFAQLVDADPNDRDPTHRPKDGDISGPIQVAESSWVILKREKVEAAQPYDPNNAKEKERFQEMLYEVKLKDEMQKIYQDLVDNASVENKLTGEVKLAREKDHPASRRDSEVKLMSNPPENTQGAMRKAGAPGTETAPGVGPLNLPKSPNAPPKPDTTQNQPKPGP